MPIPKTCFLYQMAFLCVLACLLPEAINSSNSKLWLCPYLAFHFGARNNILSSILNGCVGRGVKTRRRSCRYCISHRGGVHAVSAAQAGTTSFWSASPLFPLDLPLPCFAFCLLPGRTLLSWHFLPLPLPLPLPESLSSPKYAATQRQGHSMIKLCFTVA